MEPDAVEGEIVACYSPENPWKGYNTKSHVEFMSRMARSMLEVQPALADVGLVRHAAHHYVGRKSGIPLIGPCGEFNGVTTAGPRNFWHNVAKKGHGYMCGPGDAYALAWTMVNRELHPWITECTLIENEGLVETMK
jgi:glycine/D-amino acid oxidase-like deaminating enzyme